MHDSYNASATAIDSQDTDDLYPIWRWRLPHTTQGGTNSFLASPTVYNGVVYIGAENGYFYALNESTQTVVWSQFLGVDSAKGDCGTTSKSGLGITSTATVAVDPTDGEPTVYVFGPDGELYAINATTGSITWAATVDTPSPTENNYYSWSSPTVANDKVYIGIASECDRPLVPAGVVAYNQSNGTRLAFWKARPTGAPGASVWSSVGVLPSGAVIATTGNSNHSNGRQQLYGESIVELNGTTLALEEHWQVPQTETVNDSDFGASPTQFTATLDGTPTAVVGACNKNGTYYALKIAALTAGPIWSHYMGVGECDAAAVWDGRNLIAAGAGTTTIGGTTYKGSVQSLNPATGVPVWQTGLPGSVIGSPTEDGAGLVAAQVYGPASATGVFLLNAETGAVVDKIPLPNSPLFGQAVFAGKELLVDGKASIGLTGYEIATSVSAVSVTPAAVPEASTVSVVVKGSDFPVGSRVILSGTAVSVDSQKRVSSTTIDVKITTSKNGPTGSYSVIVVEQQSPPIVESCTGCLSLT